tara:strand:+ start:12848 stop:13063 length:216 start_codon:yes stop_codon:yes gene_type:complete
MTDDDKQRTVQLSLDLFAEAQYLVDDEGDDPLVVMSALASVLMHMREQYEEAVMDADEMIFDVVRASGRTK